MLSDRVGPLLLLFSSLQFCRFHFPDCVREVGMNRDHRLVSCSPRSARSYGSPSLLSSSSSSFFLSSLLWASERRPSLILPASNNRRNANETNSYATIIVVLNLPVRFNFFLLERSEFPVQGSPLGPDHYRSCKFAPTQRQKGETRVIKCM